MENLCPDYWCGHCRVGIYVFVYFIQIWISRVMTFNRNTKKREIWEDIEDILNLLKSLALNLFLLFSHFEFKLHFFSCTHYFQDYTALSTYLQQFPPDRFLEAISDFHLLTFLATSDMVPVKVFVLNYINFCIVYCIYFTNEFFSNKYVIFFALPKCY